MIIILITIFPFKEKVVTNLHWELNAPSFFIGISILKKFFKKLLYCPHFAHQN